MQVTLMEVIAGALVMLGAGLLIGIVIGNLWAQLDRRRFQPPPYQGRVSWSEERRGTAAGVVWSERTG